MKAISIKQPYVEWIRIGKKTLEIRSWKTNYRGRLIICASKSTSACNDEQKDLLRGHAICEVELIDIFEFEKKHEKNACVKLISNHYAWKLKIIRELEPFKVKGQLMLFNI